MSSDIIAATVGRCSFCDKAPADVRVILTRDKHGICDECVSLAWDTTHRHPPRHLYLRIAYWVYVVIASVGYYASFRFLSTRRRASRA